MFWEKKVGSKSESCSKKIRKCVLKNFVKAYFSVKYIYILMFLWIKNKVLGYFVIGIYKTQKWECSQDQ